MTGAGAAQASIIPTLETVTFCNPCANGQTGWAWTYDISLDGTQKINTTASGNPAFGTIYDFGVVLGSIQVTGLLQTDFTITTPLTNSPAYKTSPTDDPGLANIRYTAASGLNIPAGTDLGTLTAVSATPISVVVDYDGQATNAQFGKIAGNVSSVEAPTPLPEPTTAGLLLLGLSGTLAVARRRTRRPI